MKKIPIVLAMILLANVIALALFHHRHAPAQLTKVQTEPSMLPAKSDEYEVVEYAGQFAYRSRKSGYISRPVETCAEARSLMETVLSYETQSDAKSAQRLNEINARMALPWRQVDCEETVTTNEISGVITNTATNATYWSTNAQTFDFLIHNEPQRMLELKLTGRDLLVLSIADIPQVTVHTNGTVTLANTNMDEVSSNFWKILWQYWSDHYQLKTNQ